MKAERGVIIRRAAFSVYRALWRRLARHRRVLRALPGLAGLNHALVSASCPRVADSPAPPQGLSFEEKAKGQV
jgi:hypothetical protein